MKFRLGSTFREDHRIDFFVWAPRATSVDLHLLAPEDRVLPMGPAACGYYRLTVDAGHDACYFYRVNGGHDVPDPASRLQPEGVHGPSQVVSDEFSWSDQNWRGLPLPDYIFYELHVGTFSAPGTFDGIIPHLDTLKDLGITAIEIMPVAQFPGERNWGYDGVYPFAVQNSYGGPDGLRRLVDACHARGLAAVLDVVYNHLGPEGNYFREFGPYFTDRYRTPWGDALNFDGPGSDDVRRYFIDNALYWVCDLHIDALRLDAVHAIYDHSARPFLAELAEAVYSAGVRLGRRIYTIPESDLNDARLVLSPDVGGLGLSAQWSDDFHHAVHTLITGESAGYYQDFGGVAALGKAYRQGFVYTGEYSPCRGRRHGTSARNVRASQLVVFVQNHDQTGNRKTGERLGHLVPFECLKLAAGLLILSPFLPLLFMGEEYGETAPFQYFVSHSDPDLVEAVRSGRRAEFSSFGWGGDVPDPQSDATFLRSRLNHGLRDQGRHKTLQDFYAELLRLRKTAPALSRLSKEDLDAIAFEKPPVFYWRRWRGEDDAFALFHFGAEPSRIRVPAPRGNWTKLVCSADARWGGNGGAPERLTSDGEAALDLAPNSFALFSRAEG